MKKRFVGVDLLFADSPIEPLIRLIIARETDYNVCRSLGAETRAEQLASQIGRLPRRSRGKQNEFNGKKDCGRDVGSDHGVCRDRLRARASF